MDSLFKMVSEHRKVFLSSPLWLAAILMAVYHLGGSGVQRVLHFIAPFTIR